MGYFINYRFIFKNTAMRILTSTLYLVAFLIITSAASAQQFSQNYWHQGEVHLKNARKEPVVGTLKYNLDSDQIQLMTGKNRMRTYHASQLSYIQFTDKLEGKRRYFFALPIEDQQGYSRTQLFELLVEGEVSLLAREHIATRTQQVNDPFSIYGSNITTQVLEETFYLADTNGNIKEVGRRKNQPAWQAFPDLKKEMKAYFEKEKINVLYREEMFKMVSYYNSLKSGK